MAPDEFRNAIGQIRNEGTLGIDVLFIDATRQRVLIDATQVDVTPSVADLDAALLRFATEQQKVSDSKDALKIERAIAPLDIAAASGESAIIQAMLTKINWLEKEIRDLRNL